MFFTKINLPNKRESSVVANTSLFKALILLFAVQNNRKFFGGLGTVESKFHIPCDIKDQQMAHP